MNTLEASIPYHLIHSPKYTNKSWVEIGITPGRKIITTTDMSALIETLCKKATSGDYHSNYIHSQVFSLKSSFVNSLVNTLSITDQVLPIDGGRILYQVHGGTVYLLEIELMPRSDKKNQEAGLYHIMYDSDTKQFEHEKVDTIKTKHAAINGISSHISHAASMINELIPAGYNDSNVTHSEGFTLYYIPKDTIKETVKGLAGKWRNVTGIAKKTDDAMNIASVMNKAHGKEQEVKWTIHENGTAPFIGAMRVLKQKQVNLEKRQSAFYINPTSNLIAADLYATKVGITIGDRGSHITKVMSLRQAYIGGNLLGSIWMQGRHAQGNTFNKVSAAGFQAGKSLASVAFYGSVGLSAFLAAPAGAVLAPAAAVATNTGIASSIISGALTAGGYIGWGSAIAAAGANLAYQRFDRNIGNAPDSLFGQQLGTSNNA